MLRKVYQFAAIVFVFLSAFMPVRAQVVSARAGVVKKVDGGVFYRCHENEKEALDLSNKSLLHNEDTILTADSGSLVLALNPDSYLYLGPNAFVAVKNTELNKMHFDIERGQMVLFVRSLKNGASLVIHTPPGILAIRKGGRYIVSVETNGNTKANVIRGELGYLNRGRLVKLKKGRQVEFVKRKAVSENQ